jgi:uncharacterized protein (TIGR00369 family)
VDAAQETRVRESFARQAYMELLGAELVHVAAGEVDISWPFAPTLGQQNGFLHAGVVAGAIDSACGYAALTLCGEGDEVLSVEFKVNLLTPAAGESFVARGRVVRRGKTLTVCRGDAYAVGAEGAEKHVATMTATMIVVGS